MTGGTITGNNAIAGGGVNVNSASAFTMSGDATIRQNSGQIGGGVHVNRGGTHSDGPAVFTMKSGSITNNIATHDAGGGVQLLGAARFYMYGGTISGNEAVDPIYGFGGGVMAEGHDTTFIMEGGTISGNKSVNGGGIGTWLNATITMNDGKIIGNTGSMGGGVLVSSSTLNMNGGAIEANEATGFGGGVLVWNTMLPTTFTMSNGTIHNNHAAFSGGGVNVMGDATFNMSNGVISGNDTGWFGAGVYLSAAGQAAITGGSIINNSAGVGGGIYTENFTEFVPWGTPVQFPVASCYQNLTLGEDVIFSGNSAAAGTFVPPTNAATLLPNIQFASTSIATVEGYAHPLNNRDINFIGPTSLVLFEATYDANGGTGGAVRAYLSGAEHTVLDIEDTDITKADYIFIGWNTAADGSGDAFESGDEFPMTGNITLYAQWEQPGAGGNGGRPNRPRPGNGGDDTYIPQLPETEVETEVEREVERGDGGDVGVDSRDDGTIIFDDNGVPLGELVWDEEAQEYVMVYFDTGIVPLGLYIPQTGLSGNALNWFMTIMSLIALAVLAFGRKRQTN